MRYWLSTPVCGLATLLALVAAADGRDPIGTRPTYAAQSGCRLSATDSQWTARALEGWARVSQRAWSASPPVFPVMVLFDSLCSHTLTPAATGAGSSFVAVGQTFTIASLPHGGTVVLPGNDSVPARLTSFAAPLADGGMFFVMALPAVWRSSGRAPKGDLLATAVFIHEFTHTQTPGLRVRVDSLIRRGLPSDADDDVVQSRFGSRPGFRRAYESERDLLFAAAAARDRASSMALARRALRQIDRRRERYFRERDAIYADAEDLFLSMEGAGQWASYLWLVDSAGAAMPRSEALPFMRRGGRRWSQDEGLALMLAVSRLAPDTPARLFARRPSTVLSLLRHALAGGSPPGPAR